MKLAINKKVVERSTACEVTSYKDKSLDMSVRLELWKDEKRNEQLSRKETNKVKRTTASNNPYTGSKSNIPLTKTTRLLNKKFKTPVKEYHSPSKKGTYKDTNLAMRTRLDLWLKYRGKTLQSPMMSNRGFSKTPVGTVLNGRRKTCCCTQTNNKSKSVITPRSSRIIKRGSFTDEEIKKRRSLTLHNKENLKLQDTGLSASPSTTNRLISYTTRINTVLQEEKALTQSLEKCYQMFEENVSVQEEIVFCLDDIQRDSPNALRHALYWICRAKLAENVGDHERVVCMVEQASAFSAQPQELVQEYFDEYKSKKEHEEWKEDKSRTKQTFCTPYKTPSRELSKLDGETFNSSVVRFCLIDSTPGRHRRKSASEKRILTPVRRTTRWERSGITHPKMIEESRTTVASLDELSSELRSSIVYRPNTHLPCQLDEEMRIAENMDEF